MVITVGMVGYGTVGGGVVSMLGQNPNVKFLKICVRDPKKARDVPVPEGCEIVTDVSAILDDPKINVVVEVAGGTDKAKDITFEAIAKGKHVVSANKAVISACMPELSIALSKQPSVHFFYEAAVCGGIPIISTFQRALAGDKITKIAGIMNGTTNFILSKMEAEGVDYQPVLKEAQDLGYAEADPAADVEGWDARSKLIILAKLAFGLAVKEEDVPCVGITKVGGTDFEYAKICGFSIKLLGIAEKGEDGKVSVWLSPVMVPLSNAIASIRGATNVVQVTSEGLGVSTYGGAGAGRFPTANSVVADLLELATVHSVPPARPALGTTQAVDVTTDYEAKFYLRFDVCDGVGIVHHITGLLSKHGVSVCSIQQKPVADRKRVPFAIFTDCCKRSQIAAMEKDLLANKPDFLVGDDLMVMPILS